MSREIIAKRYKTAADGRVIIDIAVENLTDLYNTFDKRAGFRRRELEGEFVEYLIDSVKEIEGRLFMIKISCDNPANCEMDERVRTSIRNYFLYLKEVEKVSFRKNIKKTVFFSFLGLFLLGSSVFFPLENLLPSGGRFTQILQEGLVIAAWVLLWEFFANIIFEWHPLYQKIKLCEKISRAEVQTTNCCSSPELRESIKPNETRA